jgi:O-antigen ligase
MGLAMRDGAMQLMGPVVSPWRFFYWLRLFVVVSAVALIPQHRHLYCEMATYGPRFLHNIFTHYANSHVYGLRAWINLALSVALFGALARRPLSRRGRAAFWISLVAGLVGASIFGLIDYAGWASVEWWRPDNPYISRFGYRRLQSLIWHSGWFAQYLAAIAPAALAFGLISASRAWRGLGFSISAFLILTQLLTMQRGAWLALAAGFFAVGAVYALGLNAERRRPFLKRMGAVVGALAAAIVIFVLLYAPLRNRMGEMVRISDRTLIWRGAIGIGLTRPWSGGGIGNYTPEHNRLYPEGHPLARADDRTTAHSLILQLFAERGLAGVAAFVALIVWIAWILGRRAITKHDAQGEASVSDRAAVRFETLALSGGLAALLVDGLFQYTFYIRLTEIIFWIYLALAARAPGRMPTHPEEVRPPRRALRWSAAAGLVVLPAILVWQAFYFFVALGMIFDPTSGQMLHAAAEAAEVEIPADASRISIKVFSFDPGLQEGRPVTLALWFGDRLAATHVFTEMKSADIELDVPRDLGRRPRLTLRPSRTWRPYETTQRLIPILQNGVCYGDPVKVR